MQTHTISSSTVSLITNDIMKLEDDAKHFKLVIAEMWGTENKKVLETIERIKRDGTFMDPSKPKTNAESNRWLVFIKAITGIDNAFGTEDSMLEELGRCAESLISRI